MTVVEPTIVNLTKNLATKELEKRGVYNLDGMSRGALVTLLTIPKTASRDFLIERARIIATFTQGATEALIAPPTIIAGFLEKELRAKGVTPHHAVWDYVPEELPTSEKGVNCIVERRALINLIESA